VEMMNRLQLALEQDHFVLMAQRIQGVRGDDYHEILLRMREEHRELLASARAARAAQARRPVQRAPRSEAPSEDGNPIKQAWNNLFGN